MEDMRRYKLYYLLVGCFTIIGFIYLGLFCPERLCSMTAKNVTPPNLGLQSKHHQNHIKLGNREIQFQDSHLYRDYDFHPDGENVLVFLHMQKTGGTTFGKHLVKNLDVDNPCECHRGRKRCNCNNSQNYIWLFSRYSVGWPCGLHADWTELKDCVDDYLNKKEKENRERRYLYITILRDPIARYLSEWIHVRRGATWRAARLKCNGRQATFEEMPFCFDGQTWSGVTLEQFLDCPYNLASNRQTRMLSDLTLVGCYDFKSMPKQKRELIMLENAKKNLRAMAYFGITEYQIYSQKLFEDTFKLEFITDFTQHNTTHVSSHSDDVTEELRTRVMEANNLDIELYKYAKELFFERLHSKFGADLTTIEHMGVEGDDDDESEDGENIDEEYAEEIINNEDRIKREVNIRFDPRQQPQHLHQKSQKEFYSSLKMNRET